MNYWNNQNINKKYNKTIYVAVSGNTASGKSTLLKKITNALDNEEIDNICIDERVLHHPLLKLMFSNPSDFSFGIQLNFLLQRYLMIKNWLNRKQVLVIERSHLDDIIFVKTLYELSFVSKPEYDSYVNLSKVMFEKLHAPDILVYIDTPPEVSMERLNKDELDGKRPKEFPTDTIKEKFVKLWHKKYQAHYDELKLNIQKNISHGIDILTVEGDYDPDTVSFEVVKRIKGKVEN